MRPTQEFKHSWCIFDLAALAKRITQLEKQSENPNLWDNPGKAQLVMKELTTHRKELEDWSNIRSRIADALELAELEDEDLLAEIAQELPQILIDVARFETQTLFSGKYDREDAILSIHAGAGGTDSQDWAAILQRLYLRWVERQKFKAEILDISSGDEAGIKSVTIAITGSFAYGYLRSERGVHRLVRLSPFDSAHRRHTSFALVEVYPQVETNDDININTNDLRIDTYRSAGAGGQSVQKNETAIRITHIPSGLVVTCQNERSQSQNKENALRVLKARLFDLKQREQKEALAKLKGEHVSAEWGSQIRSYVLHPYHMVKDHRTGMETGNTTAVLDGDINDFIEAFLKENIHNE